MFYLKDKFMFLKSIKVQEPQKLPSPKKFKVSKNHQYFIFIFFNLLRDFFYLWEIEILEPKKIHKIFIHFWFNWNLYNNKPRLYLIWNRYWLDFVKGQICFWIVYEFILRQIIYFWIWVHHSILVRDI